MSENVKISVIMPVYKVEKFVGKAIESIQKQTLGEFELFAVDDGSPDGSGAICDEYAAKDSRIKVIHKENGGAPSARNAAMELAAGKYFYFMDSDDWAEPTMLEDMYKLAEENEAQLVVTGYFIDTYYNDFEYITLHQKQPSGVYNKEEFHKAAYKLFDSNLLYTPWNKLFLASYINEKNLRFSNTFWDDFPFCLSVIRDIDKVVVSEKQYYHFMRARAESETAAYRSNMFEKREEEDGWMLELYRHWNYTDDEATNEMIARRYVERLIGCIENVTNPKCTLSAKEKKAEIKKMITSNRAREALSLMTPNSLMMKIMVTPIKMKSVGITYAESKLISKVKSSNTKLFATLKSKR